MDVHLRIANPEPSEPSTGSTTSVAQLLYLAQSTKQARVAGVLCLFPVTESTICSYSLPRDGDLTARTCLKRLDVWTCLNIVALGLTTELPSVWQALANLSQLTLALSHALGLPVEPKQVARPDQPLICIDSRCSGRVVVCGRCT
jgi:hypothetical protein